MKKVVHVLGLYRPPDCERWTNALVVPQMLKLTRRKGMPIPILTYRYQLNRQRTWKFTSDYDECKIPVKSLFDDEEISTARKINLSVCSGLLPLQEAPNEPYQRLTTWGSSSFVPTTFVCINFEVIQTTYIILSSAGQTLFPSTRIK